MAKKQQNIVAEWMTENREDIKEWMSWAAWIVGIAALFGLAKLVGFW